MLQSTNVLSVLTLTLNTHNLDSSEMVAVYASQLYRIIRRSCIWFLGDSVFLSLPGYKDYSCSQANNPTANQHRSFDLLFATLVISSLGTLVPHSLFLRAHHIHAGLGQTPNQLQNSQFGQSTSPSNRKGLQLCATIFSNDSVLLIQFWDQFTICLEGRMAQVRGQGFKSHLQYFID